MAKQIIIVHTHDFGHLYGGFIAKEVNLRGTECHLSSWKNLDEEILLRNALPENTVFHYRTASPRINEKAFELQNRGYRLINKPEVLDRTSDKFLSCEWAESRGVKLPVTFKAGRAEVLDKINQQEMEKFVLKPINSKSQGAFCFQSFKGDPEISEKILQVPGEEVIVQEFVNYKRIFRVIVIGGKALAEAVFSDEPTAERWKVSVCLNPEAKLVENPDPKLLEYAVYLAGVFESEVAFVDVFETENGYVLSEINTACNLTQHERKSGCNISAVIAEYLLSQL